MLIVLFTPAIDGKPQPEIFPVDLTARNKARIESSRVYTTEQYADFLYYANDLNKRSLWTHAMINTPAS